ncbi:MAG: SDR family oxidoreductase [Myxococcales bacterium]|nr:SDR family oxidoreductase [Myxococcales bacterium]
MRSLVTGGAGFVGSHLCEALVARGDDVVCVDNFYTGRRANVAAVADAPNFELIEHDVNTPLALEVDRVFHLACPASPVHYQRDRIWTLRTAVLGTMNVLELARTAKARVLIASTSEVYGDPLVHPQVETYWGNVNPIGPRACYDEGKRCAETLTVGYADQHQVQTRIARIFNTYGPRMDLDDGRVVSNFIVQALRGEALTLYGDGRQTRSFCFVTDLVAALIALIETPSDPGPVNLGNPAEITMVELAAAVLALTGATSGTRHQAAPIDDPARRRPDITKAQRILGWTPQVELADGLRATIADLGARLDPTSSA